MSLGPQLPQMLGSFSVFALSVVVVATSFASHLCFRYLEPRSAPSLVALLVLVPALLSPPVSYHVRWPFVHVPLTFSTYGGLLVFFTLAYRLSPLHPLAKYPGPVISKSSKWWMAYLGGKGEIHRYCKDLHDRYGDIARVGPNALSIREPSLIPTILGQGGLPKGPYWDHRSPTLVAQRDPIKHIHQRKPWNRAFSSAGIREYELIVAKRTRQFIACLDDAVHRSVGEKETVLDMTAWFHHFATDFMGDMAFGGGFELMEAGGDKDGIGALINSHILIRAITSHVSYVIPFLLAVTGRKGTVQRLDTFSRERVSERLQMGASRKDLFYHLSGEELPEDERAALGDVAKDGVVAVVAGADTTTGALTATLYYLLLNPAAYERLQAEVDAAFPAGEEPLDVSKLSQMEGLNGCIYESSPSAPCSEWVTTLSQQGCRRKSTWQMHPSRPAKFPLSGDVLARTMVQHRPPAGKHNSAAFLPFSYGPANCVGKNLALMEIRIVLCWMLRRLRFSEAPGFSYEEWERGIRDWFVVNHDPLLVGISSRE